VSLRSELLLSKRALRHNLQRVREYAPKSQVLCVVKSNAYGHGATWAADALNGADKFGVAHIDEAQELRDSGVKQTIVLLEGVSDRDDLLRAAHLNCELVVHHFPLLKLLTEFSQSNSAEAHQFSVWLKINTGMNRLGFKPNQVPQAWAELQALPLINSIVLMTHLACADELEHPLNKKQLDCFHDAVAYIKEGLAASLDLSCANSAAIIQLPHCHHQWVRPGLMLFGASPITGKTGQDFDLKPVMCLRAKVIALQSISAEETVGYSAQWTASKDSTIAVVSIGYGDGYPVTAPEGTPVLVNGERASIVGRVTMDMLMVDVSDLSKVDVGDTVELWGEHLAIEEVAEKLGTIPYELMCQVTNRVKRIAID